MLARFVSDFIKPVCLPTTVEELYRSYFGQKVTVAGWGRTGINYYNDESLLKAEVSFFRKLFNDHGLFIRSLSSTLVNILAPIWQWYLLEEKKEKVLVMVLVVRL